MLLAQTTQNVLLTEFGDSCFASSRAAGNAVPVEMEGKAVDPDVDGAASGARVGVELCGLATSLLLKDGGNCWECCCCCCGGKAG